MFRIHLATSLFLFAFSLEATPPQPQLEPLFHNGQDLPDLPGVQIQTIYISYTYLSDNGHFVFVAGLTGENVSSDNNVAIIQATKHFAPKIALRKGDPVSGDAPEGATFYGINSELNVEAHGDIFFKGQIQAGGSRRSAVFQGSDDALKCVAYDSQPIGEHTLGSLQITDPTHKGQFAFRGTRNFKSAIWHRSIESNQILVDSYQTYDGIPDTAHFQTFANFHHLYDGTLIFRGTLSDRPEGSPAATTTTGYWKKASYGGISPLIDLADPIAEQGSKVMGPILLAASSEKGDLAFRADLREPDSFSSGPAAILAFNDGQLTLVALEGEPAPGTSGNYGDWMYAKGAPSNGKLLFIAKVDLAENKSAVGIWIWDQGTTSLVALEGQIAPGTDDLTISQLDRDEIALSGDGQAVFSARLSNFRRSIFATDTSGQNLHQLIGEGNSMTSYDGTRLTIRHATLVADAAGLGSFDSTNNIVALLSADTGESGYFLVNTIEKADVADISGRVTEELDGDGTFSADDDGVQWVSLDLLENDGSGNWKTTGSSTTTDENGYYSFNYISSGTYRIQPRLSGDFEPLATSPQSPDPSYIEVTFTEGSPVKETNFLLLQAKDYQVETSLRQLAPLAVANLEEGLTNANASIKPKANSLSLTLHTDPVSKGFVADGVTPLLFKITFQNVELNPKRQFSFKLTSQSGGALKNRPLAERLKVLSGDSWVNPSDGITLGENSGDRIWAMIEPIGSDEIAFDKTQNEDDPPIVEIKASLTLMDLASKTDLPAIPFAIRKPPVTLIHGYNTRGDWGASYRYELGKSRASNYDKDNFIITIRYGQDYEEGLGWLTGYDILDSFASLQSNLENTALPLFYLARVLQKELDTHLEPLHREWAFTRHDVIAHSQGGLLARLLCSENPKSDRQASIPRIRPFQSKENFFRGRFHRVITIGSPHNGSRLVYYLSEIPEFQIGPPKIGQPAGADLPSLLSGLLSFSGVIRDKFNPAGPAIRELNNPDPNSPWKPDPDAMFHLVRTRINYGQRPSDKGAAVGNRLIGLASERGEIVLPFGSDGVVDFESMGAQSPSPNPEATAPPNVFTLPDNDVISHSGPFPLFSRNFRQPDAKGQTDSASVAQHVFHALEQSDSQPASDIVFDKFHLPALLGEGVLGPIKEHARKMHVSARDILKIAQGTSSQSKHTTSSGLDIPIEIVLPSEHTLAGEVLWFVTHYGQNGETDLQDALTVSSEDSTLARLTITTPEPGEYTVKAFYITSDGEHVFTLPILVHTEHPQESSPTELAIHIPDHELAIGEATYPKVVITYDDGTTLMKRSDDLEFTSSDSDIIDVSANHTWIAKSLGSATITLNHQGLTTHGVINVIDSNLREDSSYLTWQKRFFTDEEIANPNISGILANPDGDEAPNLLEYLFAQDPRVKNPESSTVYSFKRSKGLTASKLAVTVRESLDSFGLKIQRSDDLSNWEDILVLGSNTTQDFEKTPGLTSDLSHDINRFEIESTTSENNPDTGPFYRIRISIDDSSAE